MLFFTLDMAFLLLGIGYLEADAAGPKVGPIRAGGAFGLLAAFLAWYNALAGILDDSNRYVYDLANTMSSSVKTRHPFYSTRHLADTSFLAAFLLFRLPTSPGPSQDVRGARRVSVRLSRPLVVFNK